MCVRAATLVPTPTHKMVRGTRCSNKCVPRDICRSASGWGVGMSIAAQRRFMAPAERGSWRTFRRALSFSGAEGTRLL